MVRGLLYDTRGRTGRDFYNENGVVDVYAVRDFANSNASGYGTLTGIEKYSQKEFDEHTQSSKSVRGLPIQWPTSYGIRRPLASSETVAMPECLLQLPEAPEGGLLCQKAEAQEQIRDIYHSHNSVDGYRSMAAYLERRGYRYSRTTVHKYMNTELGLHSIARPQKPCTKPGKPHKVFENRLKQDFTAEKPNRKWCTGFTYLFLKNRDVRYNCTIIGLYDHSEVASITDRRLTSDLAVRTLQKAMDSQPGPKEG